MSYKEEFYDAVENQEDHLDDLNETEELRRRSVHELREWAKSQPHFVNCRLGITLFIIFYTYLITKSHSYNTNVLFVIYFHLLFFYDFQRDSVVVRSLCLSIK